MKTTEELNALKNEVETLNKKLAELNEEELEQVVGGISKEDFDILKPRNPKENWKWRAPDNYFGL